MSTKIERLQSQSKTLSDCTLPIAYVFLSVFFLTVGASRGWELDIIFGGFYPRRYVFPFFFYGITLLYAWVTGKKEERSLSASLASGLLLGMALQSEFLLMHFFSSDLLELGKNRLFYTYAFTAATFLLWVFAHFSWLKTFQLFQSGSLTEMHGFFPLILLSLAMPLFTPFPIGICVFIGGVLSAWAWRRHQEDGRKLISQIPLASPTFWICVFMGVSFVMRAVSSVRMNQLGLETFLLNGDDAPSYHYSALKILKGEKLFGGLSYGYPFFLAVCYGITGKSVLGTLLIQSLLSALAVYPLYQIAQKICGETSARVACLLYSLSPMMIFYSTNYNRECMGVVLGIWVMWYTCKLFEQSKLSFFSALFYGIVISFLSSMENIFLPVFAIGLFGFFFHSAKGFFRKASWIALTLLSLYLTSSLMKLWLVGSWGIVRDPTVLYQNSTQYSEYALEMARRKIVLVYLKWETLAAIFVDPVNNLILISKKIGYDLMRYFLEASPGLFDPTLLVRNSKFAGSLYVYGYLFGILGFVFLVRDFWKEKTFERGAILYTIVFFSLLYCVFFFGLTRFRTEIQAFLLILVGYGFQKVLEITGLLRTEGLHARQRAFLNGSIAQSDRASDF